MNRFVRQREDLRGLRISAVDEDHRRYVPPRSTGANANTARICSAAATTSDPAVRVPANGIGEARDREGLLWRLDQEEVAHRCVGRLGEVLELLERWLL